MQVLSRLLLSVPPAAKVIDLLPFCVNNPGKDITIYCASYHFLDSECKNTLRGVSHLFFNALCHCCKYHSSSLACHVARLSIVAFDVTPLCFQNELTFPLLLSNRRQVPLHDGTCLYFVSFNFRQSCVNGLSPSCVFVSMKPSEIYHSLFYGTPYLQRPSI